MKEVERKDEKKDEAEIPDVSGGQGYVDGCFPTPVDPDFPGGDYPPYPGLPDGRDRIRGWPAIEP